MEEKINTEQGTRHHDKDELPKSILNNEVDPNSTKLPLDKKLKESALEKDNKEQDRDSNRHTSE